MHMQSFQFLDGNLHSQLFPLFTCYGCSGKKLLKLSSNFISFGHVFISNDQSVFIKHSRK